MPPPAHDTVDEAFRRHERFLWGLCYRMSGSAADADDLVQETFARALATPPARDGELRPWLTRVALNLGRDLLRRRRRRSYVGPWLPSPIETGDDMALPAYELAQPGMSTEGRYDLLESVSLAFLLALEALTPRQRAVLLLTDVFDYSVREAAAALDMSEPNVKTTHHRARRAMAEYDRARRVPTATAQEHTRQALERFLYALTSNDVAAVEAQLAEAVVAFSDGGGEFLAARLPVSGRTKVALFFSKLTQQQGSPPRLALRNLNGLPSLVLSYPEASASRTASRFVLSCDADDAGRITRVYVVVASRKLTAVQF